MNFWGRFVQWVTNWDMWLAIALTLAGAWVVIRLSRIGINRFIKGSGRALTLRGILYSLVKYSVIFFVIINILDRIGFDTRSILAGAGIAGLAVGFGAQNLVRDVITGFFIILENQYTVGEYISTAGVQGFVEDMGLRVTKIRDAGGQLHIIPNGQINQVTNFHRGPLLATVDVPIAYEEDLDRALTLLERVCQQVAEEQKELIVSGPQVLGVQNFGPSEVVIRIIARVRPMEQFQIERLLRRRVMEAFNAEGVEIPYPKQVMFMSGLMKEENRPYGVETARG